jgi:predicted DNA-binding transcriptional regulator YafY
VRDDVEVNRSDRLLGVLLRLRGGKIVPAAELARHFDVSARTIYRDVDTLAALGVPIYAELGRHGGFRLVEGYFLPAIAFTQDEAVSLVLGLALLRSLRARPFASGLDTAGDKLLAAMPAHLGAVLGAAERLIGFEGIARDAFHPELVEREPSHGRRLERELRTIDVFLQAVLDGATVRMDYRSPYRESAERILAVPRGIFWDRDLWYLAGERLDQSAASSEARLWRADRVLDIWPESRHAEAGEFDVRELLGRRWLARAMASWAAEAPVRVRLTAMQAARMRSDWYYGHARYEDEPDGSVVVSFGQDHLEIVLELLRWLGPGAELLEPARWRAALRDELLQMAALYGG